MWNLKSNRYKYICKTETDLKIWKTNWYLLEGREKREEGKAGGIEIRDTKYYV